MADGLWHLRIHAPGPAADPTVPFFEADGFPAHRPFHPPVAGGFRAAEIVPWRIVDTIVPDADGSEGLAR